MAKSEVVVAFGRCNPPTTGHARLVAAMEAEARKRRVRAILFPSPTEDEVNNPLPFMSKVMWLRHLFPRIEVNANVQVRNPFQALAILHKVFDRVCFVVGSDQAENFKRLAKHFTFDRFDVVVVPRDGMSATQIREAAAIGNYRAFRKGIPTRYEAVAQKLYREVRRHMKLKGPQGHAFLLYGMSLDAAQSLREAMSRTDVPRVTVFNENTDALIVEGKPFFVDVSGHSYISIRGLHSRLQRANYQPHIYVKEAALPRQITESWLNQQTTYGMLRMGFVRDMVILDSRRAAAHLIAETTGVVRATGKPKEPTEVDRLKIQQKQQDLLNKQRDSDDLLQAKKRLLDKQAREKLQKISNGGKR